MNTLFWYILGKFARTFGLCLVTILTIYLMVDFFEKLRGFLKYQADFWVIGSFFMYRVPEITFLLAPLAALLASILTLGGLNRTREVTAMRSSGLSFLQISSPFFAFTLVVSAMCLMLTTIFIPLANIKAEYVKSVLIKGKPERLSITPERVWLRLGKNQLLKVETVVEDGQRLNGIYQYTLGSPFQLTEIIEAKQATFFDGQWVMEDVVHREIGQDNRVRVLDLPQLTLPLSLVPQDFQNWLKQSPEFMTLFQLYDYIQRVEEDGHRSERLVTDYWARISYSLVPFVMTLIGVAVSLRSSGLRYVGVGKGLGQTLAFAFLFWAVHSVGVTLGRNGALLPMMGAWIATVMFFLIGANLFLKLK